MNTGRLVIERALESAEVRDAITKPPSVVWRAVSDLATRRLFGLRKTKRVLRMVGEKAA